MLSYYIMLWLPWQLVKDPRLVHIEILTPDVCSDYRKSLSALSFDLASLPAPYPRGFREAILSLVYIECIFL